ncbi:SRPBCC family protein [bacterium SCSIO 12741]|nr:SRPBCC family protein [bacterium SCSIO 12741]
MDQIIYVAVMVVTGLLFYWITLPFTFTIRRRIVIKAPADRIFRQVNDLRNWEKWSPWHSIDPNQKITYSDPDSGQGAWYTWESTNKNVDKGKLTLEEVQENHLIKIRLEFEKWGTSHAVMRFNDKKKEGYEVIWSMDSKMNAFSKLFGPFMRMNLGSMFQKGLNGIKKESRRKKRQ